MSGHEKFYIPHDDLVSLEAAIESLETSIDTLDTTIQDTLKERYELVVIDSHTVTDGNVELTVRNAALSATKDCFIRRVAVDVAHGTADPLLLFDSDIALTVGVLGGSIAVAGLVFEDSRRAAKQTDGATTLYHFRRIWYVNDHKICAGVDLVEDVTFCNIGVNTVLDITVCYVEDVYG